MILIKHLNLFLKFHKFLVLLKLLKLNYQLLNILINLLFNLLLIEIISLLKFFKMKILLLNKNLLLDNLLFKKELEKKILKDLVMYILDKIL